MIPVAMGTVGTSNNGRFGILKVNFSWIFLSFRGWFLKVFFGLRLVDTKKIYGWKPPDPISEIRRKKPAPSNSSNPRKRRDLGFFSYMGVSLNGGTQQPWVFIILGCFWGYHHLRKHPCIYIYTIYIYILVVIFFEVGNLYCIVATNILCLHAELRVEISSRKCKISAHSTSTWVARTQSDWSHLEVSCFGPQERWDLSFLAFGTAANNQLPIFGNMVSKTCVIDGYVNLNGWEGYIFNIWIYLAWFGVIYIYFI